MFYHAGGRVAVYNVLVKLKQGDPHYLPTVTGLNWQHVNPGGFQSANFNVPALFVRHPAAVLATFNRVIISKGAVRVFEGEIRDVKRTWGSSGEQYAVTVYGMRVLLADETFGPRVYAINDLSRLQTFNGANNPIGSTDAVKKFQARQDATTIRISANPRSIFRGVSATDGDFEAYWYQLPKVGGQYVAESITQVTFNMKRSFPAGNWAFIIYEYDGTNIHTATVTALSGPNQSGRVYTPTLANCKLIGFALRATQSQAVWPGFVDDGEGSSLVHKLEYAGPWTPQLNYEQGGTKTYYHNQGVMYTSDTTTAVTLTRDEQRNFYPDNVTRNGGALRLQFTGSKIEVYSELWSAYGDMEYRLWDAAGGLVTSGTINLYAVPRNFQQKVLDYTPPGGFGSYVLTLRCLGTAGGAGSGYNVNVDFFKVGVAGIAEFKDDDVYIELSDLQIRTTKRLTGTLDVTAGANTVTGTGTLFLTELAVGDHIDVPQIITGGSVSFVAHQVNRVVAIASDTSLTVADNWTYSASTRATLAVTADRVAKDVIARYSVSAIGLSTDTSFVNEATASPPQKSLPNLAPLAFDDPVSAAAALDTVCEMGTADNQPLSWAVWDGGRLHLGVAPLDPAAGYYLIDADHAEINHEETVQEDFATVTAPRYQDAAGKSAIGADVVSKRVTDEYAGRRRRIVLATDARDADTAATTARAYLANHDRPSQRTRVTVRGVVRDRSGMVIPLDEVRPGRLARIVGLDESQPNNGSDIRSSLTALVQSVGYDAEAHTLTLDLGAGYDDFERFLARVKKLEQRQQVRT